MRFSSVTNQSKTLMKATTTFITTSASRDRAPDAQASSNRRLLFEDMISNQTTDITQIKQEILFDDPSQKLIFPDNLSYEEDFSKQSDQETEESNSCLRSNPSDGKTSRSKGTMEIENFSDSLIFSNLQQIERLDFSRSPSPKKKLNSSPFTVNMRAVGQGLLNTPAKKPLTSAVKERTPYSAFAKTRTRKDREPISRLDTDYEKIGVIGNGSFGKVYRCRNRLDKNEYAVKETFRKFVGRHKVYGLNEIQALASLTAIEENTNVVRYYHSWVEDEKLYLVMEYCPKSLKEEMKEKGRFSEEQLKKILRDICMGLSYLHRSDIVHLDIKPENILISKTNKYKLGDMGQSALAKLSSDEIEEGDARYLAPELLNSEEYQDKPELTKADVFSLGITLLEIATGYTIPMNGNDWHDLRNERLDILDNVTHLSDSFKKVIKIMLKRDPNQRPSVKELLTKYLPDKLEVALKWEKIERNLLKMEKESLEKKKEQENKNHKVRRLSI